MIYEPPWPAILAFGDLVFGTYRAALGLTAAAAVTLIALLGRELFGGWRYGLVAAVVLISDGKSTRGAIQSGGDKVAFELMPGIIR